MAEKRPRGRPSKGIREKYKPITIYLPPAVIDALDAKADQEQTATGQHINRTDVIRVALHQYLHAASHASQAPHVPQPHPVQHDQALPETWQAIVTWLHHHPGAHHHEQIQKGLGWGKSTRHTLKRMEQAGILRRTAPGTYLLTA